MRAAELTNRFFMALEAGQDEGSKADRQVLHGIGGWTGREQQS